MNHTVSHTSDSFDPDSAHDLPFGANLAPALTDACEGRLSEISWFRTDWQRGGALTGYAKYQDDQTVNQPVVVKLPVPPSERQWLLRLQGADNVVPKLFAEGQSLGGYDMAWVVMERLAYGPLSSAWNGKEFDLLVEAVCRFYAAASKISIEQPQVQKDWEAIFTRSRQSVRSHGLANEQRWNRVLKKAHRKLHSWVKIWHNRSMNQWCHGDLHLANAMTRVPPPDGPAILLDFALTHPGHWVEDAVYLEHLFWAHRQLLHGRKLCRQIARQRREMGMTVTKDWSRLAAAKRALLAMSTPASLRHNGDARHVQAALEVLEAAVQT